MTDVTYDDFESKALAEGFDEVLERRWQPGATTGVHSHPFSVKAIVTAGEMWLTVGERTQHLGPGDRFDLAASVPHEERYGPEGAAYWVARRNAA